MGSSVTMGLDPVYYGPEGHCRVMADWNEAWQEWDAEIDEIIEEGRDQVLFIARVSGVGAASGIKVDEWSAGAVHLPRGTDPARGGGPPFRQRAGARARWPRSD